MLAALANEFDTWGRLRCLMSTRSKLFYLAIAVGTWSIQAAADSVTVKEKTSVSAEESATPVLWRQPANIASENLYYGPGGEAHAPRGKVFTFVKEDMSGTNPKFVVEDEEGVRWKVKLGFEAKPETVATRLLWAVGYAADEDYFLPAIEVNGLPHLRRGSQYVDSDGVVHNVRLERHRPGKKISEWKWKDNPFVGDRELNGLRVMMALINNWDLKNINNGIIEKKHDDSETPERVYSVTDLGASFGTPGFASTQKKAKGNLQEYEHSAFMTKITPEYVDFATPARPSLVRFFNIPAFARRVRMEELGKHVPRKDARWIGDLLIQLSPEQIADAFRAAGYKPDEVNRFTAVVFERIVELAKL